MDVEALIKQQIAENSVLLYMKGTPQFPQCGFSARTVEALMLRQYVQKNHTEGTAEFLSCIIIRNFQQFAV